MSEPEKRFRVMSGAKARAACPNDQEWLYCGSGDNWMWRNYIVEFPSEGTPRVVGADGGEPEDQRLTRDWAWVVDALNEAYAAGAVMGAKAVAE